MIHEIKKVETKEEETIIANFFAAHSCANIIQYFNNAREMYVMYLKTNEGKLIGVFPAVKMKNDIDRGEIVDNHFNYLWLVIHTDYRRQGYSKELFTMSLKLLSDIGMKKVRGGLELTPTRIVAQYNSQLNMYVDDFGFKFLWDTKDATREYIEIDMDEANIEKLKGYWNEYE